MNRTEAMARTLGIIAETQARYECPSAAEELKQPMRDWVGNIIIKEFRQAMDGFVIFPKVDNGNSEQADEKTCKELAERLLQRSKELSEQQPGPRASDETVCIFYFFPRVIGALERIALVFDPNLKTTDIDDVEDEGEGAEIGEETEQV